MKHIARIQAEFLKLARRWEDLSYEFQKGYLQRHPGSSRRITAVPPPKSPTSGLAVHEPQRAQSRDILNVLRSATKASSDTPVYRKYITKRNDRNNKYHYFAVFPSTEGGFVGANVYGRIGYPPKGVVVISQGEKAEDAIKGLESKLSKKMEGGYQPTAL